MKKFKLVLNFCLIAALSGCTVFLGQPSERVGDFGDVELCTELADKTFKYHASWQWAISDEIKTRELDSSARCESIYNSRMSRLMRKLKATPVPFDEAIHYQG
jgi:hypothetical protein